MRTATQTVGHQPQLRSGHQIRTSCPNLAGQSYGKGRHPSSRSQIGQQQFLRRLAKLQLRPGSTLHDNARSLARDLVEPSELLHMAIDRALRPGTSRPDVDPIAYLTMLMRSIASGVAKAKRLSRDGGVATPMANVTELVEATPAILDPYRELERDRERRYFAELLEELHGGNPQLEALIDAIGMRKRGTRIQRELRLSTTQLASLRRKLKRKAQRIAERESMIRRSI